jgi:hypothetical protein
LQVQFAPHLQAGPHEQVVTGVGVWQPHLHSAPRQTVQAQAFELFDIRGSFVCR